MVVKLITTSCPRELQEIKDEKPEAYAELREKFKNMVEKEVEDEQATGQGEAPSH